MGSALAASMAASKATTVSSGGPTSCVHKTLSRCRYTASCAASGPAALQLLALRRHCAASRPTALMTPVLGGSAASGRARASRARTPLTVAVLASSREVAAFSFSSFGIGARGRHHSHTIDASMLPGRRSGAEGASTAANCSLKAHAINCSATARLWLAASTRACQCSNRCGRGSKLASGPSSPPSSPSPASSPVSSSAVHGAVSPRAFFFASFRAAFRAAFRPRHLGWPGPVSDRRARHRSSSA